MALEPDRWVFSMVSNSNVPQGSLWMLLGALLKPLLPLTCYSLATHLLLTCYSLAAHWPHVGHQGLNNYKKGSKGCVGKGMFGKFLPVPTWRRPMCVFHCKYHMFWRVRGSPRVRHLEPFWLTLAPLSVWIWQIMSQHCFKTGEISPKQLCYPHVTLMIPLCYPHDTLM